MRAADAVRAADVGDEVTYVVNRNINWTNICFVGCQFCAFAVHRKDASAYNHSIDDVLVKVQDAVDRGASEVCMQGGINPEIGRVLLPRPAARHQSAAIPSLHIHAFSPMEVMYGARRTGMTYRDYLAMLRDAGLGTIPGTAAEILDDDVREVLSHKKVDVRTWVDIITAAHGLGMRSSSTVMYGHVETAGTRRATTSRCCATSRSRPAASPSSCRCASSTRSPQLYQKGLVTPPPVGVLDFRVYAVSRLMLRGWIDNLQTSWVKLGTELSQLTLAAGCNDFGGTLMEESITKAAGGDFGEYLPESEIRALIRRRRPHPRATDNHLWANLVRTASRNRVAVLAGGVGAARFLRGLCSLLDPARLTIIVNTADDETFFGLHVSPDLDTVTYTLADRVDPATGWGVAARHVRLPRRAAALLRRTPGSASATPISPRTSSAPTSCARGRSLSPGDRRDRRAPRRARRASCR